MRIKIFAADSATEAMGLVRRELGDDAVIISTRTDDQIGGVRITAALETDDRTDLAAELPAVRMGSAAREEITEALDYHGLPPSLIERLTAGLDPSCAYSLDRGLETALGRCFDFAPVAPGPAGRRVILVGAPGSGKTTTAARLARRASMDGRSVAIATADRDREGASAQLAALSGVPVARLAHADADEELLAALDHDKPGRITVIDTAPVNPFSASDMDLLTRLVEMSNAEPVLVMAAGADVAEAAEMAAGFHALGARRMVVTRLDTARRLGAMIGAADAGPFAFSEVGFSPRIAVGAKPLSPLTLARLLMRDPTQSLSGSVAEKAFAK